MSAKDLIKPRSAVTNTPFSRDRLHLVPRDEAAVAAFAMLDKVQQETPELALAGIGVLFAAMCERLSVNPHDMHSQAMRMLKPQPYHHKGNVQIEAMADFAKLRLQGKAL